MLGVDAVRVGVGVLADILCKREGFAASAPECLASSQSSTQLGHGDVALARTRGTELAVAERHCWRNVAELGHLCVCVLERSGGEGFFWAPTNFPQERKKGPRRAEVAEVSSREGKCTVWLVSRIHQAYAESERERERSR